MTFPSCVTKLLFTLLFALLSTRPLAQDEVQEQPFNVSQITSDHPGRLRSVSTDSPVATVLRSNRTAQLVLNETFAYIATLADYVQKRRATDHILACNLDALSPWVSKVEKHLRFMQIGQLNASCNTAIDVRDAADIKKLPSYFGSRARPLFEATRHTLHAAFADLSMPRNGNWTDKGAPFELRSEPRRREGQVCSMEIIRAIRHDARWFLSASVTNRPLHIFMPKGERHVLQEWVADTYGPSMTTLQYNLETERLENSTTFLTMWSGYGLTLAETDFDDPNSPVAQAFAQNLVAVDLAGDAITPSNIAILTLPLAMNLIPIAFIADMNTWAMLTYVLVTDLFSIVPFLIKGIELIRSAEPRQPVVFTFFAGNDTLAEMQAWAVECRGKEQFRYIGVTFVVIAVAALMLGLWLEVIANRYMARQRFDRGMQEKVPGPFGIVAMDSTTRGLMGNREAQIESEYLRESQWWEEEMVRMSNRAKELGAETEADRTAASRQRLSGVSASALRKALRPLDDTTEDG